ncbi:MAG TPA: DUF1223 domain-containing protein [Rhizomicrobium sp.]|jgi:hypothetical protein|nr:DUF1223 domain-containing protein [Rhizomicrobium sp.]
MTEHAKSLNVIAAAVAGLVWADPASAQPVRQLTVVELFQSQGCSDCPPANANLIALSDRPDLLTLSFGVTYWDQLGWKDTFASPQFTARQWDYARAFGRSEVFTPEVVVNGRSDIVGGNRAELEALIERETRKDAPAITYDNGSVGIGPGQGSGAVWLVRYDPDVVQVPISRGENEGRTLPHKDVVRQLLRLGDWSGRATQFHTLPSPDPRWKDAVLVERSQGGEIIAAGKLPS